MVGGGQPQATLCLPYRGKSALVFTLQSWERIMCSAGKAVGANPLSPGLGEDKVFLLFWRQFGIPFQNL